MFLMFKTAKKYHKYILIFYENGDQFLYIPLIWKNGDHFFKHTLFMGKRRTSFPVVSLEKTPLSRRFVYRAWFQ